jgi:hypothetical protein
MDEESGRRPLGGDHIVESFDYDGGRRVAVYVPPNRPEAIVFAGDGQLISGWGANLQAMKLPPTMIVGAYRTGDQDEMARIREYSPSFDEEDAGLVAADLSRRR